MQKVQKVKVKRKCKKNRVSKRKKRKGKTKSEKIKYDKEIGWLVVGNRCFLRLCQCFCLEKCFIASCFCLSTSDGSNIFLRHPVSNSVTCDIFLLFCFTFLRTSSSFSPPIEKITRWRPNLTSKWRPWQVDLGQLWDIIRTFSGCQDVFRT